LLLRDGLALAGGGVAAGIAAGLLATRALESMLYGVSANDPITFGVVAVALTLIIVVAALLPARRALAIDPIRVLRQE
jgi:ABC-type antimicrobial peptide transport system permease subunit